MASPNGGLSRLKARRYANRTARARAATRARCSQNLRVGGDGAPASGSVVEVTALGDTVTAPRIVRAGAPHAASGASPCRGFARPGSWASAGWKRMRQPEPRVHAVLEPGHGADPVSSQGED